jgi:CRISPR-associated protein Cas2
MYIILVYDVGEERVSKVCNYLRQYLPRVQNSVFEGDLSEAKLARMKSGLRKLLVDNHDSVIIWTARDNHWIDRETVGVEKLPVSNIL